MYNVYGTTSTSSEPNLIVGSFHTEAEAKLCVQEGMKSGKFIRWRMENTEFNNYRKKYERPAIVG